MVLFSSACSAPMTRDAPVFLIRLAMGILIALSAVVVMEAAPAGAAMTLAVTTTALPPGDVGHAYGTQLEASGGDGPYAWSTSSPLPEGLTLGLRGPLTGTPTAVFDAPITVTVTNAAGLQASETLILDIAPALTIETTSLPSPVAGTTYSVNFQASGGIAPYTWSVTGGPLPLGLVLTSTGILSGIPGAVATTTTIFTVTDATRSGTSEALVVSVAAPAAPPASYYVVRRTGAVSAFASPGVNVAQTDVADPARVVAIATDSTGDRYWTATAAGQVVPALGSPNYGSVAKKPLDGSIVGIAALP